MASIGQRARTLNAELAEATDSRVVHMQTLRRAIGFVAVGLPFALAIGENLRDLLLPEARRAGREMIEHSISAYFHTGMREVFVGSLCAIAMFLLCYKGYERRDNIAANVAGFFALVVALFPTRERSREAGDTGTAVFDSVTLFSSASAPDPAWVGAAHFAAAAAFFITLAIMSLVLFTKSSRPESARTPRKRQRNRVYRACGWTILACIVAIAIGKLFLGPEVNRRSTYVFWLESIAVIAFGFSWLTKGEVLLGDRQSDAVGQAADSAGPAAGRDAAGEVTAPGAA